MILIGHFVVGLLILTLIEFEVWLLIDWCPKPGCRSCLRNRRQGPELVQDDDVIAEEKRVAMQTGERASQVAQEEHGLLESHEGD